MNLPNSRKLWLLALCAGSVVAAAMTASILLEPSASPTPPKAVRAELVQNGKGSCSGIDELVLHGHGGPSGGWSYFQTGANIQLSGAIEYRCQGNPVSGQTTEFQIDISCDGSPLIVSHDDIYQANWSASSTAPTEESVCTAHVSASAGEAASDSLDETYVFMPHPENRPVVTQSLPLAGIHASTYPIDLAATASVAPSSTGGNPTPHTIELVEFFVDSSVAPGQARKIGQATEIPFALNPEVFEPANYEFYAVATDDRGYRAVSDRVPVVSKQSMPPDLLFTRPSVGASYVHGVKVGIVVQATDLNEGFGGRQLQGIQRISLYAGEDEIDVVEWRTGPLTINYTFDWVPPSVGNYELYAEAEVAYGAIRRIGPLPITVVAATDAAPTARMTLPADGQFTGTSGGAFAPVSLAASASDDHEISQMEFVIAPWPGTAGQIIVPASTPTASSLYRETWMATGSWTPTANGRYVIRARVKDGVGRPSVDSDPVEIYVDKVDSSNFSPKVRIELPRDKDQIRLGSAMPITVRAQDGATEQGIEQISVYLNGAASAAWTAAPTSSNGIWTAMTPPAPGCASCTASLGNYTLVARARDKGPGGGMRGDSPPISYTVIAAGVNPPPVSTIALPAATTALTVGTPTTLSVHARDLNTDGDISKIEIFANGVRISSATTPLALIAVSGRNNEKTASMPWTPPVNGDYDLMARVTDNANITTDSPLLKVRVNSITGNVAPAVAINDPKSGAYFELAASEDVPLQVVVNDPGAGSGGTPGIALVEFFDGSTLIGTVSTGLPTGTAQATVNLLWDQPPEGPHAITARARDSQGSATTSEPINIFILGEAPTISILSPVSGQPDLVAPEHLWLRVDVRDDSGRIQKVEYFRNGALQGVAAEEPFEYHLNDVGAGNHTLTARAYDFAGHSTLSDPVNITVAANQLPTVAITEPLSLNPPAEFGEGNSISLAVFANDPDESRIESVEYLRNGSLVATGYAPSFRATWTNAGAGLNTQLTARAYDARGGVGTTATPTVIHVIAATPPSVILTAPVANSTHYVGDVVTLSADASDPDQRFGGRVLSVQFFSRPLGSNVQGNALGAPITAAPYSMQWVATSQQPSNFEVYARAIDNGPAGRNTTNSSARPITVKQNTAPSSITLLKPAMPSHYGTNPPSSHTVVAPNAILQLEADVVDLESNVERVEFYLRSGSSGALVPLRTVSLATPNNGRFVGEAQLTPAMASTGISFVHAKAYDAKGRSVETSLELPEEGQALTSCGGRFGACANTATPIAIVDPARSTTPCSGAGAVCLDNRHLISSAAPTRIEAERYDRGGHGVAFFERDEVYSGWPVPDWQLSVRGDEVDLENCDANLGPGCVVGEIDDGETLRYSVTMPTGQPQNLAVVRKLRIWIPSPETRITFPCDDTPIDSQGSALLEAEVVSGLTPGQTRVEFWIDGASSPLAVVTPPMNGSTQSSLASYTWPGPVTPGTYQIKARTVIDRPPSSTPDPDIYGEFSPTKAVIRALNAPPEPVNCTRAEGRWIEPEHTYGDVGLSRTSGGQVQSTCASPTRIKVNPEDSSDHWYDSTLCPVELPAGDYWLEYHSPQDGVKLDYLELSTQSAGSTAPVADLQSPTAGTQFAVGSLVTFTANVTGAINHQTLVDFTFNGGGQPQSVLQSSGTNGSAPYSVARTFTAVGSYTVTVRATVNGQVGATSTPVQIQVVEGIGNSPPQVSLAQPASSPTQLNAGSTIQLQATASDPDGTINSVVFNVNDGQPPRPGVLNAGFYSASWTAPEVAQQTDFTVSATATDSANPAASTTTGTRIIRVAPGGTGIVYTHDTPAQIPTSIDPRSDGVGATVGEFRVDESGSATYSIPILTVPGRAGVQPELNLSYHSQSGSGPIGRGWSIGGASAISRCRAAFEHGDASANNGSPPIDFTARDQFCLDGQKLVLVDGTHGGIAEYRTELDGIARIRSFRVGANDGPSYFVVQRKDGTTSWYGDRIASAGLPFMLPMDDVLRADAYLPRNDGTGINEPAAGQPAISWAINRSMDSNGNYIDYRYLSDRKIGLQLLQRVEYTGKTMLQGQPATSANLDTFAAVELNYSTLAATDWVNSHQGGMLTRQTRELSSISSFSANQIVRHYRLSYTGSDLGRRDRMLVSLQECADTGTGPSAVCYRPTTFEWTEAASQLSNTLVRDDIDERRRNTPRLGDIDGDGLLDMVWMENKELTHPSTPYCAPDKQFVWVQYSGLKLVPGQGPEKKLLMEQLGQKPTCSPRRIYSGPLSAGAKEFTDSWMLYDVNGDGKDDLLIADNIPTDTHPNADARWHAYPSNGRTPDPAPADWRAFNVNADMLPSCASDPAHCVPVSSNGGLAQAADINGDGMMDLLFGETGQNGEIFDRLRVKLFERVPSPGTGFRFSETMNVAAEWTPRPDTEHSCASAIDTETYPDSFTKELFKGCTLALELTSSPYGRSPRVLELDGDGRADLLARVAYRTEARLQHCDENRTPSAVSGGSDLHISNGSAEEALALERFYTDVADGGRTECLLGQQTRTFFYELVVDRIEPPAVPGERATVWLREYGRQLQSNVRPSSMEEYRINDQFYTSIINTGDLNGDGLQELMLIPCDSVACEPGDFVQVFDNDGQGFKNHVTRLIGNFRSAGPQDYAALGHLQVMDYNGDGRSDLLFPQSGGEQNTQYSYRLARPDGSFSETEACTATFPSPMTANCTGVGGGDPNNWVTFFADMDGDGLIDYFAWQGSYDGNGSGGHVNNFRSARSPSRNDTPGEEPGVAYRQRGLLKAITNGYGAKTSINYEPMTNGAVYRKGFNGRDDLQYGRKSPVLDVLAPMYLVSKVESDAPSLDAPEARSAIYYQYEGARMQSGGRGLLGFSEIRSIDANFSDEHFITITRYRQDFPFIGMPEETRKYRVDASYNPSNCRSVGQDVDPATCMVAGNAANAFFAEPAFAGSGSRLISYARNRHEVQLTHDGPGARDARYAYAAASYELSANTDELGSTINAVAATSTFIRSNALGDVAYTDSVTMRGSGGFGSLASLRAYADAVNEAWDGPGADMGDIACDGTLACVKRTRTYSSYLTPSSADYWRLGRLSRSEVTQWRYNASGQPVGAGSTRVSAFEYDMASTAKTGQISAEIVQPDRTDSQYLRTAHFYDVFGNPTLKLLCSRDVAASACDDPSDYLGVLQRPVGFNDAALTRVHRYARTEYDADRRFAIRSLAPYFNGDSSGTQAIERSATAVRARDLLGNVTESLDNNGVWSRTRFGRLGRTQGASVQVGQGSPPAVGDPPTFNIVSSLGEYHWCSDQNGGVNEAPCPTGAVFRLTSYADGGTRSVAYHDKLGRVVFGIKENFNSDGGQGNAWVGQATQHDRRGRPIRVSEPFFVAVSGALRPDVAQGSSPWNVGQVYWTQSTYDAYDRPTRVELPEHTPSAPAFTALSYDGLTTTTQVTVFRDEDGVGGKEAVTMQSVELKDATGKLIQVTDHSGLATHYGYDDQDNMTLVRRDAGRGNIDNVIEYDEVGRKKLQTDPDAGALKYFYNAAGETICTLDARNMASIADLDALGRAWRRRVFQSGGESACTASTSAQVSSLTLPSPTLGQPGSVDVTVYDYDVPPGAVHSVERLQTRDSTGSNPEAYAAIDRYRQDFQYDPLARPLVTETSFTPPGGSPESYSESVSYDPLGRVATARDATGGRTENMYSAHGFLRRVRDADAPATVYWEGLEVDVRGQTVREFRHSNAITTRRGYDQRNGRLQSIITGQDNGGGISNPVQNLAYDFDGLGNLLRREDQRLQLQEDFLYDKLNRLLSGKVRNLGGTAVRSLSIELSYDRLGNICSKSQHGTTTLQRYHYAGRAGCGLGGVGGSTQGSADGNASLSPHAVESRSTSAGTISYLYDFSGNQYAAGGVPGATNRTIRFNAEGMADKVMSGTPLTHRTEYRYGPSGRYLRIDDNGAGLTTTTRYLGGVEWITKAVNGVATSGRERRRSIGGFLILTDSINDAGAAQPIKFRYQLGDHLGSIDTLVDQNGAVVERMSFDPHGNRRNAEGEQAWSSAPIVNHVPANTTRGYTGHEHIDSANIVHMNGRLYDPALGRMLSADPLVQDMTNAQNLNRYTYVLNNPLSFTDPTGLAWFSKYWRSIVALAITIFAPALAPEAWSAAAVSVAAGFVAGVVTTGTLRGGLLGAFSAALFHGIGQGFADMATVNIEAGVFGTGLRAGQFAAKVMTHGIAGGIVSVMQGGKFGHGFAAAGVTQALSPAIDHVDSGNKGFSSTRVAVAAMVGGTTSVISGGKFANGAVTAAFSRAYNDEFDSEPYEEYEDTTVVEGKLGWNHEGAPALSSFIKSNEHGERGIDVLDLDLGPVGGAIGFDNRGSLAWEVSAASKFGRFVQVGPGIEFGSDGVFLVNAIGGCFIRICAEASHKTDIIASGRNAARMYRNVKKSLEPSIKREATGFTIMPLFLRQALNRDRPSQ